MVNDRKPIKQRMEDAMNRESVLKSKCKISLWLMAMAASLVLTLPAFSASQKISVLIFSDIREEPFSGFKKGMTDLGLMEGKEVV